MFIRLLLCTIVPEGVTLLCPEGVILLCPDWYPVGHGLP